MSSRDEIIESSYLSGANAPYIEELYQRYLASPSSVDASWQEYFAGLGDGATPAVSWNAEPTKVIGQPDPDAEAPKKEGKAPSAGAVSQTAVVDAVRAQQLARAYRVRGHLAADLDPLGIEKPQIHADLDPASYGFTNADFDRPIFVNGAFGNDHMTLAELIAELKKTYAGSLGVEFMHIQHPEQRMWVQDRMEQMRGKPVYSKESKKAILETLLEVECFEEFVQKKYTGQKRFSIQGGDAMVPGMVQILETASRVGVEEMVIGMPHRGRMNVLTTIMGKPYSELLSIFNGNLDFPDSVNSSGDVKYHLGASHDRLMQDGHTMHLSLTANPSHLEAVNPVVSGKVRAKQDQLGDGEVRSKVMGLMLHGDAAFAGQGTVPETLSLAELRGYRTGGTVHIVVNNQIGFTTSPKNSRFTPYPTDVAKAVQAPIFHVNGEDPEAVVFACEMATEFRQKFGRDTVIDIICYRKYGHNEGDEPMFTQPMMYKAIAKKKLPAQIYADRLAAEGSVSLEERDELMKKLNDHFQAEYDSAKEYKPNKANWLEGKWAGFLQSENMLEPEPDTGVDIDTLKSLGKSLATIPADFKANSKIVRQLKAKEKMMDEGQGLDWSMGEALGFASLLGEKYKVRITGQDSERGTFSHRHSVLTDQETEAKYTPLNNLGREQGFYEVHNSSLSELAILGFEYGYSLAEPDALTIWEAQFGDFCNGAQMIIDQFISSGEVKWLRMSGLVMLLPHGYEGQGPEHSSARLERFLQLCGENNMQVANITTPANFFHALRRQLHRKYRKPLIVMTPKSLLRHKLATSSLEDMKPGTSFQRVIPEIDDINPKKVRRVVFTSGKLYYELLEKRRAEKIDDVALVRIEQYYPFPAPGVKEELERYKDAEVAWAQEEPENMGAWRFIGPRIGSVLDELGRTDARITYLGRPEAASPAAGYLKIHTAEQQQIHEDVFANEAQTAKQKKRA